ncbi:hypothetical protein TWF730_009879 [Orbilia blumenaviensis]|uniref:Uncharacterized protein n=1 Tax=Orbilia blumenaviensis TaxID=1796055 RepID=A0AAV9UT56_9PEZI
MSFDGYVAKKISNLRSQRPTMTAGPNNEIKEPVPTHTQELPGSDSAAEYDCIGTAPLSPPALDQQLATQSPSSSDMTDFITAYQPPIATTPLSVQRIETILSEQNFRRNVFSKRQEGALRLLRSYKTVLLIDEDIGDMPDGCRLTLALLEEAVSVLKRFVATNQIEIRFLRDSRPKVFHPLDITEHTFRQKIDRKRDPDSLLSGLEPVITRFMKNMPSHTLPKNASQGLNVVCLTSGRESDKDSLANYIESVAKSMLMKGNPPSMIGLSFGQIGDFQLAKYFLGWLDEELRGARDGRRWDIVDTTQFKRLTDVYSADKLVKLLVGGFHKTIDHSFF